MQRREDAEGGGAAAERARRDARADDAAAPPQQPGGACPAEERTDCGFNGIGQNECVGVRGCCWDSSPHPAGPQCFFHDNQIVGGPLNITFAVAPLPGNACFRLRDVFGFDRGEACAAGGEITVLATDGPMYLL